MTTNDNPTSILLVEDDSFLAGMYVQKLELEGYQVHLASDGRQGLKAAAQKRPDLIMLDIILPKMDGYEVLEQLKKDTETRDIPVVLLTNLGQREDVKRGLKLGAEDYLIKAHFMPSEVIEKIKKLLS